MAGTTNRLAVRIFGVTILAVAVLAIAFRSTGFSEYPEHEVLAPIGEAFYAEPSKASPTEGDGFDETQVTDGVPHESLAAQPEPGYDASVPGRVVESEPPSVWPAFMEGRIQEYLAQYSDLGITNIQRIECKEGVCEIEIYGTTVEKAEEAGWQLLLNVPEEEWHVADIDIRRVEVYPHVEAIIIELYPEAIQTD